jgi:type VI secretion system protein ImpJ
MVTKLARVRWEMGQTLLPEHLKAQEESVLAATTLRFNMLGLPAYGVGNLALNETLLVEGIISIGAMTLVMNSGLMLSTPGNASISTFNLNVPGTTTVRVYLHVLKDGALREGSSTQPGSSEEAAVPRVIYALALSSEQNYPGSLETLKLAEFEKNAEGMWRLSPEYVPPLIRLGTTPFFKDELLALAEGLNLFQYNLSLEVAGYLSGDSLSSVKQCLKAVYGGQRLLNNLAGQVKLHPYALYEELYTLLAEVSFYRNVSPQAITTAYDHENLGSLGKLVVDLNKQMQLVRSKPPYLPFVLSDNINRVALPEEIRQASSVFLLVQKERIASRLALDNLKLTCLSRLSFVHQMALHGVPIKKIDQPPFQHSFGSEVDFYQIKEGEEWDHALNEMSLAFFAQEELSEGNFFLFWRIG